VSKRIYIVTSNGGAHRLIRATTPAQAIRYAVASDYNAEVASQEALVGLLGSGIKVEDAVEPEPVTPPAGAQS
jgi:hypothetical protein